MDVNRRSFLRSSLAVLGATATAVVTYKGVAQALGQAAPGAAAPTGPTAPAASTCAACSQSAMPALTADHQLVHGASPMRMALPVLPSNAAVRQGVPGRKWVMVVDLSHCDGCGMCIKACSKMHFVPLVPPTRQYIKVLRMQDSEFTAPYYFPQPCYHCDNPPCTKVCPVDATFKREDGIVLIDNERCIGCRFCMAACPYGARSFNWAPPPDPPEAVSQPYSPERGFPRRIGTVEKCDFCPDMAEQGMLPACVSACPMGVLYYGDQNEDSVTRAGGDTFRFSAMIRDNAGYRQMEELGTEPRVYYLPPKNRMYPGPPLEKDKHEHA